MTTDRIADPAAFEALLAAARAGSVDDLGRVLMHCRGYLLLVANQQIGADLQAKLSPSDVVHETFAEAIRDFAQFDGRCEAELLGWLGRIQANNLANSRRWYEAQKRDLRREVPLEAERGSAGPAHRLPVDTPTPCDRVSAAEQTAAVEAAIGRLPERARQVIRLRYRERLTFAQIGAALGCSPEAARKIWARAVDQLQHVLGSDDGHV